MAQIKLHLGATDGMVKMPDGTEHYIFGFVDLTGLPPQEIFSKRGQAHLVAPLISVQVGDQVELTLTNLGMPSRPDLDDTHTIHWHGFPNQIPLWDGVPEASFSVPVARNFTYYYEPKDPGTYMYHCHFEPVEHIQMGMVGPLICYPADFNPAVPHLKTAYGAGTGTEFHREYFLLLTELDPTAHEQIFKVQSFDWTEYKPAYWLLNGRAYPHTVLTEQDLLPFQPYNALLQGQTGEKILLRVINLGFEEHALTILGLRMRIMARDAKLLPYSQDTNLLWLSPGQTADVIIEPEQPGLYPLYNRYLHRNHNGNQTPGGMISHVQINP